MSKKLTEGVYLTSQEKAESIVQIADEMKAEQIETLDVREKTSIADYFVICAGTSDRHTISIADKVVEEMKKKDVRPLRTEGEGSGWILLDYGDVVFHAMREEQRQFYDLESFWKTKMPESHVAEE